MCPPRVLAWQCSARNLVQVGPPRTAENKSNHKREGTKPSRQPTSAASCGAARRICWSAAAVLKASQPQRSNSGPSLISPEGQLHRIGPGLPGVGSLCLSLIREPSRIDAVSIVVSGRGPIRAPRSRKSPRLTRATAPARVAQRIEFPDSLAPERPSQEASRKPLEPQPSTTDGLRSCRASRQNSWDCLLRIRSGVEGDSSRRRLQGNAGNLLPRVNRACGRDGSCDTW